MINTFILDNFFWQTLTYLNMKFFILATVSLLAATGIAAPAEERSLKHLSPAKYNKAKITEYFRNRLNALKIVKTTRTSAGQTIDWIPKSSQGKVAAPPPLPKHSKGSAKRSAVPGANTKIAEFIPSNGPDGTVPVYRVDLGKVNFNTTTLQSFLGKNSPDRNNITLSKREADPHWYSRARQFVDNYGGHAVYSVYDPATESTGFSLLQTSVGRTNGANGIPGTGDSKLQTLEAGLIVFPGKFNDYNVHLFTFYNTNGYIKQGDNIGGWNKEVKGWVQIDTEIGPGIIFTPTTVIGGDLYILDIEYQLFEGNWWLFVKDRWIGYYPASLFSNNAPDASLTLADHSDRITYYGEVLDSDATPGLTTTDMGSGVLPSQPGGQAAFIREILYRDLNGNGIDFDGTGNLRADEAQGYGLETHFNSGEAWSSYILLGGPGSG
jgi:Neprosin